MNKYERVPQTIVDLHGCTVSEAKNILDRLFAGRFRHIRIITGKATFRPAGPVLRPFVKEYLSHRNIRWETSKLGNGGDGALEVYSDQ